MRIRWQLSFLLIVFLAVSLASAQGDYDPTVQSELLLFDEARTVSLGNVARRDNGIPPCVGTAN